MKYGVYAGIFCPGVILTGMWGLFTFLWRNMNSKGRRNMWVSVKSSPQFFPFCCFQGRPLSVQQQMMQQSRQLDPNLLVKQQTPPSQQQSIHQPAMKSFLENVMPHTTPELQKGPSPINAFSNFPIGGFLCGQSIQQMHRAGLRVSLTC